MSKVDSGIFEQVVDRGGSLIGGYKSKGRYTSKAKRIDR